MNRSYLPATFRDAALRGLKCQCPRCGGAPLFRRWLKPVDSCAACGQDWTHQKADDFPAYIAILLTGHLMGFLMIPLVTEFDLSVPALIAILMTGSSALMLAMLQPVKGAVIAAQWWHGLHGFVKERLAGSE